MFRAGDQLIRDWKDVPFVVLDAYASHTPLEVRDSDGRLVGRSFADERGRWQWWVRSVEAAP